MMINVPRILKIDHKQANSPARHKINEDFNANDHSRYTKYPEATEFQYFQNLGQAFNNSVVTQVCKNVEYSMKSVEDLESKRVREF